MSERFPEPDPQGAMRTHEVVDRLFQLDVALQIPLLFGVRQGLAYQPAIALAGSQVVAFDVRGVDLGAPAVRLQDLNERGVRAEQNLPFHFHHASPLAPLVDRGIAQVRVYDVLGCLGWAAWAAFGWRRFRHAVVGNQRSDIRRKLVTGEKGRAPVGSGLEFRQKQRRLWFATLMAEVAHHAQAAGQGHGAPDPHITDLRGSSGWRCACFF